MNVKKEILDQAIAWRHHIHQNPEVSGNEVKTAAFIADVLRSLGLDVTDNIGGNGVVGVLKNGSSGHKIGFRTELDGLPLQENSKLSYASNNRAMHACGHDGHMAMLLGAAAELSSSKDFDGTICFVFQPAEELTFGARAMIEDGFFHKFPIQEIYGMHNVPFHSKGVLATKTKGIMSSEDDFMIRIKGNGCHASTPHEGVDPFLCFTQIYQALQNVVSRRLNPTHSVVISCTELHTDGARNAIPANLKVSGDVRCFRLEDQEFVEKSMREITASICTLYGAEWEVEYHHEAKALLNDVRLTGYAIQTAKKIVGEEFVNDACDPWMASEDFSEFLDYVPGCFMLLGTGESEDPSHKLHHTSYDFADEVLDIGIAYWVELAKERLSKNSYL